MQKRDKGRDKDKLDHLDPMSKDLIRQYRAISAKMKKRFLKKPNLPEASREFGRLGNASKYAENHDFAALCYSAMAKCDRLIGDVGVEAESWAMAGREFLEAEDLLFSARHVSYWDSLEAAIHCFLLAIKAHEKHGMNVMAAMFCQEIGGKCEYFEKYHQAMRLFIQASDLQKDIPECRLQTLARVAHLKVILRDYEGALAWFGKMTAEARAIIAERDLKQGPFVRYRTQYEICQLILLLMLKYPRKSLKRENIELLDKYSKDILDPATFATQVNKERYILLQSLITACETRNYKEIEAIRPRIWGLLDSNQQHLYKLLMETHSTKQLPNL